MPSPEHDFSTNGAAPSVDELRERVQIFQSILDQLPDPIKIIDRHYNVVYLNAAARKRNGKRILDHAGEKCYQVFYNRNKPCAFCSASKTFRTGKPGHIILKDVRIRETESCFEELLSLPVRTDHGDIHWIVEIAKDVTKEKELERQLIHSGRLISLGEMMTSIAHEFNNPLGIMMGFAQEMLSELAPSDPCYSSMKIIHEEAGRCKKIMQDLMAFGRPSDPRFAPTDAREVVHRSLDLVTFELQKSRVKVAVEIEAGLPSIHADAQQLQQVLVNLFLNALEAMPNGGVLTIRASKGPAEPACRPPAGEAGSGRSGDPRNNGDWDSGKVSLSVKDTGHGISPETLPMIFRPFFTTKKKKGMGLGLSICERIVKAHGGRIQVESTPDLGTTFQLHLPVERREHERQS